MLVHKVSFWVLGSTLVAILLAGCGQGGTQSPGAEGAAKNDEISRTAVGFAHCMREHGHQVPDPTFDDQGLPVFAEDDVPKQPDAQSDYQAVRRECRAPLNAALQAAGVPNQKGSPEQLLGFTRCMREHGVELPDPTPQAPVRIDKVVYDSPAWPPAAQACGSLLPPAYRALLNGPGK